MSGSLTLKERITAVLIAAGFREYEYPRDAEGRQPSFIVAEGVGATVNLCWDAPAPTDRAALIAEYETALRGDGLFVTSRDHYLYVPDPARLGGTQ